MKKIIFPIIFILLITSVLALQPIGGIFFGDQLVSTSSSLSPEQGTSIPSDLNVGKFPGVKYIIPGVLIDNLGRGSFVEITPEFLSSNVLDGNDFTYLNYYGPYSMSESGKRNDGSSINIGNSCSDGDYTVIHVLRLIDGRLVDNDELMFRHAYYVDKDNPTQFDDYILDTGLVESDGRIYYYYDCWGHSGPDPICTKDSQICSSSTTYKICDDDGFGWETFSCGSGNTCKQEGNQVIGCSSSCVSEYWPKEDQVCSGQTFTQEDIHSCSSDLTKTGTKTCSNGQICNPSSNACENPAQVCLPSSQVCQDIDSYKICKSDGSGYLTPSNCLSNQECFSGYCVEEGSSPTTKFLPRIYDLTSYQSKAAKNDFVDVKFSIANDGTISKDINVEAVVMTRSAATQMGYLQLSSTFLQSLAFTERGLVEVASCQSSEQSFVKSVKFNLGSQDDKTYIIRVPTPNENSVFANGISNWDPNGDYLVIVSAYEQCSTSGEGTILSGKGKPVQLTSSAITYYGHKITGGVECVRTDNSILNSGCDWTNLQTVVPVPGQICCFGFTYSCKEENVCSFPYQKIPPGDSRISNCPSACGASPTPPPDVVNKTTGLTKQKSMLLSDWEDSTAAARLQTVCETPDQCGEYTAEDGGKLTVNCLGTTKITNQLDQDAVSFCEKLDHEGESFKGWLFGGASGCAAGVAAVAYVTAPAAATAILTLPAAAITAGACVVGGVLGGTSVAAVQNAVQIHCEAGKYDGIKGACIAQPKGGDFFGPIVEAINNALGTDFGVGTVVIVLGVLILLLFIFLSKPQQQRVM